VIDGPPAEPASEALGDVLAALAGERWRRPDLETLQRLWPAGDGRPAIRREEAASFLILSPTGEEDLDLDAARLAAVWLDGVEVRRVGDE
jgi:hypothetical protein